MHLYTLTDSGLVQIGNARSLSCDSVMSGKDDVMMESLPAASPIDSILLEEEKVP